MFNLLKIILFFSVWSFFAVRMMLLFLLLRLFFYWSIQIYRKAQEGLHNAKLVTVRLFNLKETYEDIEKVHSIVIHFNK